ncbi:MAG TPA: branched-chain amino acid ABC transporter substrate-binding protein [Acidimicrobiales bacterium]|nr:branched-chain amino acid ABC transporter substrate-binding protein [Acidimicrobiales bacterium]
MVALVGAACAGDDDDDAETSEEEFTPGELGAVDVAPGDPILIGAAQAISGDTASLGTDQQRAIEIAIADRDGELLGHELELQAEDDECAAEGGTTSAQRLVAEPQLVAVIGTSCSGAAVPAAEILAEEGILMISASNTSPALTSDLEGNEGESHQDTYFRTAHNDIVQGQAAANFAFEELGAQTAATIHDGDPYTEGLATAFETSFTELGGEVVVATAVNKGDTDMRPVLTEVSAANPDLVFFPIFQPEADFIAAQSNEFPELEDTSKLMGADGLLSDTFIVLPDTEDMYFSGPATPTGSAYEEFVQKYEDEFGEGPIQAFHAHAYDAANLLFDAIEAVAVEDEDGTLHIDRQALLDEVGGTSGYEGLTGTLTCDDFGDCADPVIDVVQNGQPEVSIEDVRGNVLYSFEPEPEE